MSTTVGTHSGAGPLSLMSCVRESSPLADFEPAAEKNVSKRKFWNPRKWFRKKQKTGEETSVQTHHHDQKEGDGSRSRSTGELSTDEEPSRSHNENRNSSNMHPGLSVSHDSVFHPLNSGSSDLELDGAQSSSSLSISQPLGNADLQTELSSRLRLRRGRGDTSEDDEGLPRSPPCGSPAAAPDSFLILEKTANKDLPTKSHSTCSDGSLLSMDSSEMDDDSVGLQSRHSSKVSLNDKRTDTESDLELGPSFTATPLNHSAAHHKVSVRPKRTYGAPRRKKGQLSSALPATPEVNEDSSVRSVSPESAITEPIGELYDGPRHRTAPFSVPHDVKLKCNSLPAGAVPPTSESFRLSRSKSNAGKSQDDGRSLGEEREEKLSLFERLFPRRSAKKKRKDEERFVIKEESATKMEVDGTNVATSTVEERRIIQTQSTSTKTTTDIKSSSMSKPTVAPRTGAAARQRIQPIDIPVTPQESRAVASSTPERTSFSPGTSPIHMELENVLRQRQLSSGVSTTATSPPQSPKPTRVPSPRATPTRTAHHQLQESRVSSEDIRSKIKIAGLSSLQQRVLSLNSAPDEHESYKSLIDFPTKPVKPVAKSHSFKGEKTARSRPATDASRTAVAVEDPREKRKSVVVKAASLDSVENLEEPKNELKLTKPMETDAAVDEIEEEVPTVAQKKQDNTCSSSSVEEHSVKTVTVPKSFSASSITISGPSHTAVVNVTSSKSEEFNTTTTTTTSSALSSIVDNEKSVQRESQVSVTKIQLQHETTQVTRTSVVLPRPTVPEFLNMQLNKVDAKPASNVVLSIKSPKASPEEAFNPHPKSTFALPVTENRVQLPRKFSKEDVEIIEKSSDSSTTTSPPKTPPSEVIQLRFKKNDSRPSSRKSSVISISLDSPTVKDRALKARSISLDSLKTDDRHSSAKASQDGLDKRQDGVVLRRKSFAKQHKDDEPELMKVFARRSLKLKDGDADQIQEAIADEQRQRDSDKENKTEIVAETEKKVVSPKIEVCKVTDSIATGPKMAPKEVPKEESKVFKQPLAEIKKPIVEHIKNGVEKDEPEVQLRKSLNNNIFLASQRAASLNAPSKMGVNDFHIKKQASLNERRKTDQWMITPKREAKEKGSTDNVDERHEELVVETKNFSQRRAEWEKRVQQAQK